MCSIGLIEKGAAPQLGESLDALATISFGFRDAPRSELAGLYAAARAHSGGGPITYEMAKGLLQASKSKSTVLLATGEYEAPGYENGETDGPLGVAALARTLCGLGREVVLCHDPRLNAAHQVVIEEFVGEILAVAEYPGGRDFDYRKLSESILASHDPSALVSVEKLGRNLAGVYHAANGRGGFDAIENRIDDLFDLAAERDLFTLGFGDYGNEVGFGAIVEEAREISPNGRTCACGCGQGIVAVTPTTHVLPCAVSNWGAIAVADMLAALSTRPDLVHTGAHEEQLLDLGCKAGLADGAVGKIQRSVDGVPGEIDAALVELMAEASQRMMRTKAEYFGSLPEHLP